MYAPEPDEKFDFQNIDVKLYLALRALLPYAEAEQESLEEAARRDNDDGCVTEAEKASTGINNARRALEEFELSHGGIPDWAVDRNWDYSLVPGAQLCTRDGRRTGNAHIIKVENIQMASRADRNNPYGEVQIFHCLTDAGSKFAFTEVELLDAFTIGDWLSDPQRVLRDFDRNDEFSEQPNE